MGHWVASLSSFALHVGRIRDCLKAVRTREEALDEMHRRREALTSRAAAADKKLKKMKVNNKNLQQQTDLLTSLREQISAIDAEIMDEEASLGDWKRVQAREWMSILFSGLLECSEKGTVVATFSRAIIGCVPTGKTEPGLPRANYSGQSQVKPLMEEAKRKLQNISFAGGVGDDAERPPDVYHPGAGNTLRHSPSSYSSSAQPMITRLPQPYSPPTPPNSPPIQSIATHQSQPYASTTLPNSPPSSPSQTDEFGGHNSHLRSQTLTPGQNFYPSALMAPASPTQSRMSPPPGSPEFTPGHQLHPSQSLTVSRSNSVADSIANDAPLSPISRFRGMPEIQEVQQMPSEA